MHEPVHAEPTPHDVFREQAWPADKSLGKLVFGNKLLCKHDQCERFNLNALPLQSLTLDLQDATKVRAIPEYWSGHVGTSEKSLIFNPSAKQETDRFRKTSLSDLGQGWVSLPLPVNTPGSPECFHALLSHPAIAVDLGRLQHGSNQFTIWAGKQICYGFQYPALRLRSLVMRTFYKSSRPHPTGTVIAPKPGATIGESVVLQAAVGGAVDTDRVEFFAQYDDFSWEGDGVSRRWHYRYDGGKLGRHVGTATHPPYQLTWSTEWLPTQSRPLRIKARIIGKNGITYVTPVVENLTLQRDHTVRLYNASDVPQNFQSRANKRKECTIPVPDELTTASAARLLVALGAPHEKSGEFGLNGKRLATVAADSGRNERAVSVPLSTLARSNRFYAYSTTPAHAMEIYWPGPALLVRFDQSEGPASDAGVPLPADAGVSPLADAHVPSPDAGIPSPNDAGALPPDASVPSFDDASASARADAAETNDTSSTLPFDGSAAADSSANAPPLDGWTMQGGCAAVVSPSPPPMSTLWTLLLAILLLAQPRCRKTR